jgi:hypothetical protein
MRIDAVVEAGQYRADLIAGEEPELCVRLRAAGWRIWRLDAEMSLHDAAMTRFGQWWFRALRGGYAIAHGAHLHRAAPERLYVWQARRAWLLGVCLPSACVISGLTFGFWGWSALLIYPLHMLHKALRKPWPLHDAMYLALFDVVTCFAESWGQMRFLRDRLLSRSPHLIEYK